MKKITLVFLLIISSNLFAWNALGHRIIAQIAFDNMDGKSRAIASKYNSSLNTNGHSYSMINSAVWLDHLYSEKYKTLRTLHYIDIPFSTDNTTLPKTNHFNAVFAILIANQILSDKNSSRLDKAISSRILWHVVGDIHQPMHAVSRISKQYPNGDRGGNLVRLTKNPTAKNLHAYWDRGAGKFIGRKRYRAVDVKNIASEIERKWPCNLKDMQLNPNSWALESYTIARNFSYAESFDANYQTKAQEISERRVALAGCRLAALVKNISDKSLN
ncbi:MAG: S1/P1 nuclease [Legionellaceae bacterium]|nr:S1/P1 nuclease [Legionellaceae bacterium]